jgi:hypothetical protein
MNTDLTTKNLENNPKEITSTVTLKNIVDENLPLYSGTLIINPPTRPLMAINLGDQLSFISLTNQTPNVKGIAWNENDIALILDDRNTIIRYNPETHPYAALFFEKKDRRSNDDDEMRIWEGEFEPVQFTKQNLLKFLKLFEITDVPKDVIDSIKNMKLLERKTQEDVINLDENSTKMVIEESSQTNIPKKFSLQIPLSENYIGKFEFEAHVAKKKNRFGNEEPNKNVIVLRCLNGRQVLRDRMIQILNQLPKEIPKYYGKMIISGGNKDEHW